MGTFLDGRTRPLFKCRVAGIIVCDDTLWGLVLVVPGVFAIFEATAKWCLFRACGIKTKF